MAPSAAKGKANTEEEMKGMDHDKNNVNQNGYERGRLERERERERERPALESRRGSERKSVSLGFAYEFLWQEKEI